MAKVTESQAVYERIEELKGEGNSNAEAVRIVAKERGKNENAIRANQHVHRARLQKSGGVAKVRSGSAKVTKQLGVDEAVTQARTLLENALASLDEELDSAKHELTAAQAHYDRLAESAKQRKADLESKIKALS